MTQLTTYIGTKVIQAVPAPGANGAEGYRMVYANGYTSWSPKEAFEEAYRKTDAMTFGDALVMLKAGKKVARAGSPTLVQMLYNLTGDSPAAFGLFRPAALNVTEFTPSREDMLAEDWRVVE